MRIKILDPIYCSINATDARNLRPILSFPAAYYVQEVYRKRRVEYTKSIMTKSKDGTTYYFLTGFLDRIKKKFNPIIEGEVPKQKLDYKIYTGFLEFAKTKSINFREDQKELIETALKEQRGILQAPTGTGKTLLGLAIAKTFEKERVLWLCHTKDLMYQVYKDFKNFGFKNVTLLGDSHDDISGKIVIATRQSFISKIEILETLDAFDPFGTVIVDEAHHISKMDGEYAKILGSLLAIVRIGLTATMPTSEEALLAIEGFLGPILGEVTINKAAELDIIAKPKIKLIQIPKNYTVSELKRYPEVYDAGIVNNKRRNEEIVKITKRHVQKNESVLIIITKIEHGLILLHLMDEMGIKTKFVYGATEGEQRVQVKEALNKKKILCVICSTIFREGVNIPELNVIINACGGKSEIMTLQAIGRGLRKTKTKNEILIYDFFDPSNRFLIDHFGHRICLYMENSWI